MQSDSVETLYTSFTSSLPQLVVNVDEQKAMAQGVPVAEIYSTLAAQFGASYINDFNKYGRVYRVYMQADSKYRATLEDLSKVYVKNNQGKMLPLTSVISTKNIVGPYKLTRFNMYPSITFNGLTPSGVSSGEAMAEMEKISDEILPKDMGYAWSGTSLQEKNSAGQIGPILTMALTFVYLFLVALYESWMLAFSVMCCMAAGLVMFLIAPFFPQIYNTDPMVKELATWFIRIAGMAAPIFGFVNATYFTLRSGGKTGITFVFDSGYMWVFTIPLVFCLSRFTGLSIVLVFFICQFSDLVKVGFTLSRPENL
jgi:Cu/Ag efflux pump CusA